MGDDVVAMQSVPLNANPPLSGCAGGVFASVAMTFNWSKHVEEYVYVAGVLQAETGLLLTMVTPTGQSGILVPG